MLTRVTNAVSIALALASVCFLTNQALAQEVVEDPNIHALQIRSDLLSCFYGRDVLMHAGVVAPPDRAPGEHLPICFEIHGFGASHAVAWGRGKQLLERMNAGDYPRMLYVYPNAQFGFGHHAFADSVNNGPWARALVEELLPAIESAFDAGGGPDARFVTGRSSGGWSSLWLQVTHPGVFGGTWSVAPDPVDFRDFAGLDLYSSDNVFTLPDGSERPFAEMGGSVITTRQAFAQEGGRAQLLSFEAAFSPRGEDGRPIRLFDRETGVIDESVVQAWKAFDISAMLHREWRVLRDQLSGRLRVFVGDADDFQLDGAVELLGDRLDELDAEAQVVIVPGRGHFDLEKPHVELWPRGFHEHAHTQMRGLYDASRERARRMERWENEWKPMLWAALEQLGQLRRIR